MSGRYESRYLRAVDPAAPRAARGSATPSCSAPAAPPAGSLLVHALGRGRRAAGDRQGDAGTGAPRRRRAAHGRRPVRPGRVTGAIAAGPQRAAWDLAVHDAAPPLRHLPAPALPRAAAAHEAGEPGARWRGCRGTVEAGGRRLAPDGWPGMTGHNWGDAARRALALAPRPRSTTRPAPGSTSRRAACASAGATTPWIANGASRPRRPPRTGSAARARGRSSTRAPARAELGARRRAHPRHRAARADGRVGLRRSARRRAPRAQLLDRRARADGRRAHARPPRTAASTSWASGSGTTACPWPRSRIPDSRPRRHPPVHVERDVGGAERPVVDPHLVDPPREPLAPDAVAADRQRRRARGERAGQRPRRRLRRRSRTAAASRRRRCRRRGSTR